ncbi:MAG: cupin domain-containing protein, partial [Acetobacteraceae bacterium]
MSKVIDLRAYAASASATADWLTGRAEPVFSDAGALVTAFVPTGEGRVISMPADEFVIALSGELAFRGSGGTAVIGVGQSAVLPAGVSFEWRARPGTLAVVMACHTTSIRAMDIVPVDIAAPLAPSNPPLAELLVGPTPSCRNHADFRSANGELVCGTWDSTPYHRRPMVYRHIELMHLLEGAVTLEDSGGLATFSRGDTLLC